MTTTTWQPPKAYLRAKGIKMTPGETFDPAQHGMPDHPVYGPLPKIEVISVKEDGTLLAGVVTCECGAKREIGAGDWFQVRRCEAHQKKIQRANRKIELTPEEKAVKEADKAAKKATRDAARAETKLAKQKAKLEADLVKIEAAKKASAEKIAQVAAEMGVPVSTNAPQAN